MIFRLFRRRRTRAAEAVAWQRARASQSREPASVAIDGRRYLTQFPYALPKDGQEINRLDFQHFLLRQALAGNYLAPIGLFPTRILDVGCGTGRWGREMARQFPLTTVIGLDLEEMATSQHPSGTLNYQFARGNVLEPLPFPDDDFDFVHQRLLVAAIPAQRWPEIIRELARVTRHNGWIELVECGVEVVRLGPLTRQFFSWGIEASASRGLDARVIPQLGDYLREAGLRDVRARAVDIPIGEWGGRVGVMMKENLLSAFSSLKTLYTQRGSEDDFASLMQELPAEWEHHQSLYRFYVFYGKK
jgi:ubiquinone/menaquinone biosynthesis C-methylase UbiE